MVQQQVTSFRTYRKYQLVAALSHTLVCQIEATGEENSLSPETAQLTTAKAVCTNVFSNTRIVEYIHMAHTFGLEST